MENIYQPQLDKPLETQIPQKQEQSATIFGKPLKPKSEDTNNENT